MLLSRQEHDDLHRLVAILWGQQFAQAFAPRKSFFNERTLSVVERGAADLVKCNADMLALVASLAAGLSIATKGWLRKILHDFVKELSAGTLQLNGLACMNFTAGRYRTEVEMTLI